MVLIIWVNALGLISAAARVSAVLWGPRKRIDAEKRVYIAGLASPAMQCVVEILRDVPRMGFVARKVNLASLLVFQRVIINVKMIL